VPTKIAQHGDKEEVRGAGNRRDPVPQPLGETALLLSLQRTHGNRFVQRLLNGQIAPGGEALGGAGIDRPPRSADTKPVIIQGARDDGQPLERAEQQAPEDIQAQLGPASSMEGGLRGRMESVLGQDFSGVRLHTDSRAAALASSLNARAFTIGSDVAFGAGQYQPGTPLGDGLIAHELAHVVQQQIAYSLTPTQWREGSDEYNDLEKEADASAAGAVATLWAGAQTGFADLGRNALPRLRSGLRLSSCKPKTRAAGAKVEDVNLLKDFAGKFPDAAALIAENEEALGLVREAEDAGAGFGGYAEEGPYPNTWPYTVGHNVYVPKVETDKVLAARDFLFELNNAIREPKFMQLHAEAAKGAKSTLTAKQYARRAVGQEVEGMLRLGNVWFELKKTGPKGSEWDKYDRNFYVREYKDFQKGTKTKDDLINEILQRRYTAGANAGKTVEQYYMEVYESLSGGT
jgi:hypothetical protein